MGLARLLKLLLVALLIPGVSQATQSASFDVFSDDFNGLTLEEWGIAPGSQLLIDPDAGRDGSAGLAVTLFGQRSNLVRGNRRQLARAEEAYLTFSLNADAALFNDPGLGFLPNRAIRVAAIQGESRTSLVGLRIYDTGLGRQAFLEWRDSSDTQKYDFATGSFPLASGWQEITIGFRRNEWVSCWVNGLEVRTVTSLSHFDPYASIIEIGKTNSADLLQPEGKLHFDDARFHLPRYSDLWVDQENGDDANDGITPGTAFASISRASDLAGAGTIVHIQPGVYREAIVPAQGGGTGEPVTYRAEAGLGSVVIRGSESSGALDWTQLGGEDIGLPQEVDPNDIWWTDLSSWNLTGAPAFVVDLAPGDPGRRLPLAREPDWTYDDPYRSSQLWWRAEGGSLVAQCDPQTSEDPECDLSSRSKLQLTDRTDDDDPRIEPGNLSSLGSLVGATLVARDCVWGHRLYRRSITEHDLASGRVTVDAECLESNTSGPGLGWGTQYYVENHPSLLDEPGEWWFDPVSQRLFLWPPSSSNPSLLDIEVSRHDIGFDLKDRSYTRLEALVFEFYNGNVIEARNWTWQASVDNKISSSRLRFGVRGVLLSQSVEAGSHADKRIETFVVETTEISHMDHEALRTNYYWDDGSHPDAWTRPGIFDVIIKDNMFNSIGFRTPHGANNHAAVLIIYGDRVRIEGNSISDSANEGIQLLKSVVQSPSSWGFSPSEIRTGEVLIRGNTIERVCQLMSDCGALRILGSAPDTHAFRDLLVSDNTLRDTFGWSLAAELRGLWKLSQQPGAAGIGLYVDQTTGVHAFRNVSYNNSFAGVHLAGTWRDGEVLLVNTVAADNAVGVHFGGLEDDTHPYVGISVLNNIFINNEAYGISVSDLEGDYLNFEIDSNLYFNNGWRGTDPAAGAMRIQHGTSTEYHRTVNEITTATPFEGGGQGANPLFLDYSLGDHDPFDRSRPDFRLLLGSPAVDAGITSLPPSLESKLALFGLADLPIGLAYDQGAFEGPIDCSNLTISHRNIEGFEVHQTCHTMTLGPELIVTTTGALQALAGKQIVLNNDTSIAEGAELTAETGVFP